MSITQQDIADRVGVSRRLVGFALTGSPMVAQETRQRIEFAAMEMGYRPNGSARAMKSGRFGCAALLLSTHPHVSTLPGQLLQGINDELAANDMHLSLAHLPHERLSDSALVPKILREWMADGLLIDLTHDIPNRFTDLIHEHKLPAIWLNSRREADCVFPDDFEAGQRAGKHLLELGHRHIAFGGYIGGPKTPLHHYSAFDRRDGVEQAVRAAGGQFVELLPLDDAYVSWDERVKYWRDWLRSPGRPTALVTYSAGQAEPALFAAELEQVQVPRDLSLVTFEAPNGPACLGRGLTSYTVPDVEVGRAGVRHLLQKIEAPDCVIPPKAIAFGYEPGNTCAAPPK